MKSLTIVFGLLSFGGVQCRIPDMFPSRKEWFKGVGIELLYNGLLKTVQSKEKVEEVWNTLGGPEMAKLSLEPKLSIDGTLAALFLAGELANAGHGVPTSISNAILPLCQKIVAVPESFVYLASDLLLSLRQYRRILNNPLTPIHVYMFTPIANFILVCGSNNLDPSLAQVILKSVLQREIGDYKEIEGPSLAAGTPFDKAHLEATGLITDYPRERLISGAIDPAHLQVLYDAMYGKRRGFIGLFDKTGFLRSVSPVQLNKAGQAKYFVAGRALALSIVYGVPVGHKLDPNLLTVLCGASDKTALLELQMFQSGFQDIIPSETLQMLKITSNSIGDMLSGMDSRLVDAAMVLKYVVTSDIDASEIMQFSKVLKESDEYSKFFVYFATGLQYLPLGGLASIMPPISLGRDSSIRTPIADRQAHRVTLPTKNMRKRSTQALNALSPH